MDIVVVSATILMIGVAMVLAIIRIREQNKLRAATQRLVNSYSKFDTVLDEVSEFIRTRERSTSLQYSKSVIRPRPHVVYHIRRFHDYIQPCQHHRESVSMASGYRGHARKYYIDYVDTPDTPLVQTPIEQRWFTQTENEYELALP